MIGSKVAKAPVTPSKEGDVGFIRYRNNAQPTPAACLACARRGFTAGRNARLIPLTTR